MVALAVTVFAWLLVLLNDVSDGGLGFFGLVSVWAVPIALLLWLVLHGLRYTGPASEEGRRRAPRVVRAATMVFLTGLGLVLLLSLGPVATPLLRLRVALSQGSLEAYVADVRAGRTDLGRHVGRAVGLFRVTETELVPGAVRLITTQCRLLDDCGLAYSWVGEPPRVGEDRYRHLRNRWWHWFRSW